MKEDEIRSTVLRVLAEFAPEVEPSSIKPDVRLRDQVDLDSMDFLNILIAIHEELNVDIPESDYAKLSTLNASVDYLKSRVG